MSVRAVSCAALLAALCVLALALLIGVSGSAIGDVELDKVARVGGRSDAIVYTDKPLLEVQQGMELHFDTDFSLEWHPKAKEKATPRKLDPNLPIPPNYRVSKTWHLPEVRLNKSTTLREGLAAFCHACDDLYTYRIIDDQICLIPIDDAGKPVPSIMDKEISLSVKNATTEQALKMLFAGYNAQYPQNKLDWITSAEQNVWRMPEPYYTQASISLDIKDMTLREAVCRVFAASPIKLSYRYCLDPYFVLVCANYKMPDKTIKK